MPGKDRPKPPDELDGEALLEWHRICDELDALGYLNSADRAVMTIYCQTWQANQEVTRHLARFGAIAKHNNGVIGQTPHYKTQQETARMLVKLLHEMGLSPAARNFDKNKSAEPAPLEF